MSEIIQFKISVDGRGLKDMESMSRAAFSGVEREQRASHSRLKGAERDLTDFYAREAAKRRQSAIDDFNHQKAEHVRNIQRQLDEARRLQQAQINSDAQTAARHRNRNVNDFYRQLGWGSPDEIRKATENQKKAFDARHRMINAMISEDEKLIRKMRQVASGSGAGVTGINILGGGGGGGANRPTGSGGGGGNGFLFSGGGLGSLIGNSAIFTVIHAGINAVIGSVQALISGLGQLGIAAVKVAGDFEKTYNALSVATGSIRLAKQELAEVDAIARNTTGLRLEAAEEGYTRLRNLGFAAKTSQDLLRGIAVQKIISGADEAAINRVIVNITQLSAGSIRASQDIKEIILAMPSIRQAFQDAFGTLNPQTIAAAFRGNPDEAVEKLAAAMARAKAPAGGLNEALDKLVDEAILVGRAFGEPILDPLTVAVKGLTVSLYDNEDTWRSWGQTVADAIEGANNVAAGASYLWRLLGGDIPDEEAGFVRLGLRAGGRGLVRAVAATATVGASEVGVGLEALGEYQREEREREIKAAGFERFFNNNSETVKNIASRGFTVDFGALSDSELAAKRLAQSNRERALEENARKAEAEAREKSYTLETQIARNNFQVREALLSTHIARTKAEEAKQVRELSALKRSFYTSETARISTFYDKQIELANGDEIETAKLTNEKAKAIFDINRDIELNAIETQRRLTEIERQATAERRQNQIEFNNIQIDSIRFHGDQLAQEINRGIERGTIAAAGGFANLRDVAETTFQNLLERTRANYALQLQDDALTAEKRANIQAQYTLDVERLTEDRAASMREIEDRSYQTSIAKATEHFQNMRELWSSQAATFGEAGAFFNPENFSADSGTAIGNVRLNLANNINTQILRETQARLRANVEVSDLRKKLSADPSNAQFTDLLGDAVGREQSAAEAVQELTKSLAGLSDRIPKSLSDLEALGDAMATGAVGIEAFDQASKLLLNVKHIFEQADLAAEIGLVSDNLKRAVADGRPEDVAKFRQQLLLLGNKEIALGLKQQAESLDQYNNSLEGLADAVRKLEGRDPATLLGIQYGVEKDVLRERAALLRGNIELEYRYAHIGEDAAARYRRAWLEAITEVKNASIEARESQIQSQVRIAQQTVFNADVARAGIMEAMAGAKGYTEIFQDAFLGVADAISGGIGSVIDKATEGMNGFVQVLGNVAKQLLTMVTNRLMMKLLDAILPPSGGARGASAGGGGGFGSILSGIGRLFGIGGNASTPGFNPNGGLFFGGGNAGSAGGGAFQQLFNSIINGGGATPSGSNITSGDTLSGGGFLSNIARGILGGGKQTAGGLHEMAHAGLLGGAGKFSFANLGKSLGAMAPLLGLGLGSSLGGMSIGGQVLGGIGGLAGGLAAGIASGAIGTGATAGFSIFGTVLSATAATGILAAVAAPLLIGSYLLGRNKQRRADEVTRTTYINDALGQLNEILKNTTAHKYNSGQEAIDAANAVRDNYRQQASSLKSDKTRRIALKEINDRINPKIAEITAAAGRLDEARGRFGDLIPEFATGGIVPGQLGAPRLVLAHGGEIIANASQQTPEFLGAAERAGVPGVRGKSGGGGGSLPPIHVELRVGRKAQNEMFVNGSKSPQGYEAIVNSQSKRQEFERDRSF